MIDFDAFRDTAMNIVSIAAVVSLITLIPIATVLIGTIGALKVRENRRSACKKVLFSLFFAVLSFVSGVAIAGYPSYDFTMDAALGLSFIFGTSRLRKS